MGARGWSDSALNAHEFALTGGGGLYHRQGATTAWSAWAKIYTSASLTKSDITALGIPGQDTTYGVATTSANGLMSSTDKTKLNDIDSANFAPASHVTQEALVVTAGHVKLDSIASKSFYRGDGNWIEPIPFILGTQSAATGSWTGVCDVDALYDGLTIRYWLPYAGSGSATLNLTLRGGGTTGAINCYYNGTTRLTTHYGAGNLVHLTYRINANVNGTNYTGWWSNCNYLDGNNYDRTYWGNAITAGAAIYSYKLLMQGTDGKFYPLTLETGTGTTKTVSTQEFEIHSQILYYATTTTVAANGTLTNVYSEYPVTVLQYTANQASWTSQKLIYLKGKINSANGNFKLDNTTATSFMTQTLPTTEDGFVYILLGYMYGTTGLRLFQYHPIYEFRNGAIRLFVPVHSHGELTDDGKVATASRVIVSDANGKVTTSSITTTILDYLSSVTGNIQTQINTKGTSSLTLGTSASTAYRGDYGNTAYAHCR